MRIGAAGLNALRVSYRSFESLVATIGVNIELGV